MSKEKLASIIESVLFIYGEEMGFNSLLKITESKEDEIEGALKIIKEKYGKHNSGLVLILGDKKAQITTNPANAFYIEKIIKDGFDKTLTISALETLTIIAYLGPVSRARIDQIRGVNSSFILRNLLIRGLIEKVVDKNRSYVILYNVTGDTLKFLGIAKEEQLPEYEKYRGILEPKFSEIEKNHE
ncbi:MAG: hypothetical protein COV57_03330 [Candidatus Liptonbacteria bacterium CG11_big_fil_rev_8_21_14_0_20_35_14]|uniref:SMC-Scp complex subunit ScpB n=1 Tax=Candidatus Liptonbacteria bacterium CG11_big_fil_rev_8_21_14_0_20_35_14 TaxID=1974634 RepID=A0A2H0N6X5_9BACT|nr:MAG: hypothetical protein COV57_03330 [Candidatus Liptonbacteria bacterium CG11_big_fil_rev_8_21_14_0_20_35_14]